MIFFLTIILIILMSIYRFFPKVKVHIHPPYDALLILGYPANEDGTLSKRQQERCDFAISLIEKGYSNKVILSGGCVKNTYSEANVMGSYIQSILPHIEILLEEQARNTYQNIQLTKALYPYENILIVTSPAHIRRSWFFIKKFYKHADIIACKRYDAVQYYLFEYTRLWVCMYYEIKLRT